MAGLIKKLSGNVTTVFNGNGFVSRSLIARLAKAGSQIVIGYRGSIYSHESMKVAGGLGQIYFSRYDLRDEDSLREAMKYSNIVVNTIGKMNETKNFSFWDVHVEGPRRMAKIAKELGVEKFIHISDLNCAPNPEPYVLKKGSQFLKSKYYGELAVREEFPEAIIFRPSNIVGESDSFIVHWTSLLRSRLSYTCPIWDYYDGVEKQPVYVRDLTAAIEAAILNDAANGKVFQAVGPYRYSLYDLIEYTRACGGQGKIHHREITNLRWDVLRFFISFFERFSKYPFMTWERVEHDHHSDKIDPKLPTLENLGIELTPLEKIIAVNAFYRPRDHRVEYSFEEQQLIEWPRRLNEASSQMHPS